MISERPTWYGSCGKECRLKVTPTSAPDRTLQYLSSDNGTASQRPKLVINYNTTNTEITQRSYYSLGGQTIASRVVGGSSPGLYYVHADHLGSTQRLSTSSGSPVLGSDARYLPFGKYRVTPTAGLTDRGFTGHLHNDPLGLVYMNARYYVPYINRFLSADTIVPDPKNPQQFNRYGYSLNNPLRYIDPTGHCAQDDDECWVLADQLYQLYGWYIEGVWTIDQVQMFLDAGQAITDWFAQNGGGDAIGRLRASFGGTVFAHADFIGRNILGAHHVRSSTVYLLEGFGLENVVHELGHVLDNRLGFSWPIGSALFGGGPADDMSRALGADPSVCANRSRCVGYETPNEIPKPLLDYGTNGPSEDFAESFRLSVLHGAGFQSSHPMRAAFLSGLANSLTTARSEYTVNPSPYLPRRIGPIQAPTPGSLPLPIGTPMPW